MILSTIFIEKKVFFTQSLFKIKCGTCISFSVILAFHPSAGEFSTSEEFFEATRLYRHEDTDIDGLRVMECAVYEDVPTNPQEIDCPHLFCYYCVQVTTDIQCNTWQYFKYFGIMNIHDDSIVMDFMGNFLQPIFIRTG